MLVPSNRDPHISIVIIVPDLAIERPGRLVTNAHHVCCIR